MRINSDCQNHEYYTKAISDSEIFLMQLLIVSEKGTDIKCYVLLSVIWFISFNISGPSAPVRSFILLVYLVLGILQCLSLEMSPSLG